MVFFAEQRIFFMGTKKEEKQIACLKYKKRAIEIF